MMFRENGKPIIIREGKYIRERFNAKVKREEKELEELLMSIALEVLEEVLEEGVLPESIEIELLAGRPEERETKRPLSSKLGYEKSKQCYHCCRR